MVLIVPLKYSMYYMYTKLFIMNIISNRTSYTALIDKKFWVKLWKSISKTLKCKIDGKKCPLRFENSNV